MKYVSRSSATCIMITGIVLFMPMPTYGQGTAAGGPTTDSAPRAPLCKDIPLAIASARAKLRELSEEPDQYQCMAVAQKALELLRPFYSDPRNDDLEAWRLLGVIALVKQDRSIGALALASIRRVRPDYLGDAQLADLVTALNILNDGNVDTEAMARRRAEVVALATNAEHGDAGAQTALGVAFELGDGVPRDVSLAVQLYRTAASKYQPDAQYNLGLVAEYGKSGCVDIAEAKRWYGQAALRGQAKAQERLDALAVKELERARKQIEEEQQRRRIAIEQQWEAFQSKGRADSQRLQSEIDSALRDIKKIEEECAAEERAAEERARAARTRRSKD